MSVTVGVACMYALLFTLALIAALVVISTDYLQLRLGHPANFGDYVTLAWLACSLSTRRRRPRSSFDSEAAIRQATYGRRQRERQARSRAERQQRQRREQRSTTKES